MGFFQVYTFPEKILKNRSLTVSLVSLIVIQNKQTVPRDEELCLLGTEIILFYK